jgi:hypothetical protein
MTMTEKVSKPILKLSWNVLKMYAENNENVIYHASFLLLNSLDTGICWY